MKYCPQCNRQFTESWLSFCSDDGTPLIHELTPPADPNWDPKIREPQVKTASEQETLWLPREPLAPGGWIAPDERPPMSPGAWTPPPPPYRPAHQPSQSLALASMITGIVGLVAGGCLGPIPGIIALALGLSALSQIKKSPEHFGGKPYATAGVIIGAVNIAFYVLLILWFVLALSFG
ncbi:MAG TPA: DUF4190 domain-containing protein [Pyrinomonadaceae bacterium]|nr:DUF4190 domain-containing protein [Pyrinomonadaceae bacterium]